MKSTILYLSLFAGVSALIIPSYFEHQVSVSYTKELVAAEEVSNDNKEVKVPVAFSCQLSTFNPFPDTLTVKGDSLTLKAGSGFRTYAWSDSSKLDSVKVRASGRYSVTVTDASGCIGKDSVVVHLIPGGIQQTDTTICLGNKITLEAKGSLTLDAANSGQSGNLYNDMIAWYPLDGNTQDLSRFKNHGTIEAGPVPTSDRFGKQQGAYRFNGNNGNIWAKHMPEQNALPLTVSCWMRTDSSYKQAALVSKYYSAHWNGWQLMTMAPDNGRVEPWYISSHTDNVMGDYGSEPFHAKGLYDGKWHHIVFTIDTVEGKLYVDGKQIGRQPWRGRPTKTANNNPLIIGWYGPYSNEYQGEYRGDIDEVMLFSKALSSSEVLGLNQPARRYRWSTGDTTASITVSPTQATTYYLTTTTNGLSRVDSVRVSVGQPITPAFNPFPDKIGSSADSVRLDAGAGFARYRWSNGDTTPVISVKQSGGFRVRVTNATGCTATDSVFVQFQDTLGLHLKDVQGICNEVVDIPVTVTGFRNIFSMQGSINWNPAELRFESISSYGVSATGMNAGNFGTAQTTAGKLSFSWNDANALGLTLPDSSVLFTIRLTCLGSAAKKIAIGFANDPLPQEVYDGKIQLRPVRTTSATVDMRCTFTIFGSILSPLEQPLKNVTVTLTGGVNTLTATSAADGSYSFKVLPGTYVLTPSRSYDPNKKNGLSTVDVALIQAHILQRIPFNQAYKTIAADVNNSGGVTSLDIVLLRRMLLDMDTSLPGNRLWAYVDGGQTFASAQAPFPAAFTKTFTNQSSNVSHIFRGIKIGDVNYDRNPLLDQAPSGDTLRLFGEWTDTEDGYVTLKVKSRAVSGLLGWQSTLRWDAKQLQLEKVTGLINNLGIGERWKDEGYLTLSWNDPRAEGPSFTEGSTWMELRFRKTSALQRVGIGMTEEKLGTEAFNGNYQSMGVKMEPVELRGNDMIGSMRVYPNPATQYMNVEWKMARAGAATVRLLDAQGRVVHVQRGEYGVGVQRLMIKRSGAWSVTGTWMVQVEVDGEVRNVKVVMGSEIYNP